MYGIVKSNRELVSKRKIWTPLLKRNGTDFFIRVNSCGCSVEYVVMLAKITSTCAITNGQPRLPSSITVTVS